MHPYIKGELSVAVGGPGSLMKGAALGRMNCGEWYAERGAVEIEIGVPKGEILGQGFELYLTDVKFSLTGFDPNPDKVRRCRLTSA